MSELNFYKELLSWFLIFDDRKYSGYAGEIEEVRYG